MTTTPEQLFEETKTIHYEGSGMKPIPSMKKIGFFPGGNGMWNGQGTLAEKDVLILGQDFNNETAYLKFEEDDQRSEDPLSRKNATWWNLRALLGALHIELDRCFFSNVFMGMRSGSQSATGACPGISNTAYYQSNIAFLKVQIAAIQPNLILLLGEQPVRALQAGFPEILTDWSGFKTMTELLTAPHRSPILEAEILNQKVIVAAVLHPSFAPSNRPRIFKNHSQGEVEQLSEGLKTLSFQ